MSLSDDYTQQAAWRPWSRILDALPELDGRTVLDLGCGVGDQAAELVARGASVIGYDASEELLTAARAKALPRAEFHFNDLRTLPAPTAHVDGLWSSFVAAYFPADLPEALSAWKQHLRPGGWIALTEIDDLFGHEPLGERTRTLLDDYARDSLRAGRYDFRMGGRLEQHLREAGFTVRETLSVEDRELAFDGPAIDGVVDAWRARFERMKLLRDWCGPDFEPVRDEFLACLARDDHRSRAKVSVCVATC